VAKTAEHLDLCEKEDLPRKPSPNKHDLSILRPHSVVIKPDITCKTTPDGWRVVVNLGKIQAMDTAISCDVLCVGVNKTADIPMVVEIFSDDLPQPVREELLLRLNVSKRRYSVDDFVGSKADEDS